MLKKKKEVKVIQSELQKKDINLLPEKIVKQRKNRKYFSFAIIGVFAFLSIFSFYMGKISVETKELELETKSIIERIEKFNMEKENQKIIFVLEEQINFKKNLVNTVLEKNTCVLNILDIIDINLPNGVMYTLINSNSEENITINGFASDYKTIATLVYNLKSTKIFKDVFLEEANKNTFIYATNGKKSVRYNFSLVCEFGGENNEN